MSHEFTSENAARDALEARPPHRVATMTASHDKIEGVFSMALQRAGSDRSAFIGRACDGDAVMIAQVLDLLDAFDRTDELLPSGEDLSALLQQPPPVEQASRAAAPSAADHRCGTMIGRYRIVRTLGEGGMSLVYLAEQDEPRRQVALKLLRPSALRGTTASRLRHEAQILARLRHAGIAQIHDAGMFDEGDGAQPYFAMEYVPDAMDLLQFAERQRLGLEQRLRLVAGVCDAVHYGHQRGIIHRDLKPANILVDAAGQPRIIDFGVARCTDSDLALTTLHTEVGQLIGTVLYMSPEQIAGEAHAIDTRSDVYSLGVILFELLTGRLPYDLPTKSVPEAARVIRDVEPIRIGTLDRRFRGDIETILRTAMEKDPQRRYQSALELAQDLRRFMSHEPLHAAPPSAAYRLRKFIRRNRALSAALAAMIVIVLAGIGATTWGWLAAAAAQQRAADEASRSARALAFVVRLLEQPTPGIEGHDVKVIDALADAERQISQTLALDPPLEFAIRSALGEVFFGLGQYDDALRNRQRTVELSMDLHGEPSLEHADALARLGVTLGQLNRAAEGERALRAAVEIRESLAAPRDDDHALILAQLAAVLEIERRYDESRTFDQQALAIAGERSHARMEALAGLGVLAIRARNPSEALRYSEQAHALSIELNGATHADTIALVNNIAFFRAALGDREGGIRAYLEAIEAAEAHLGERHPHVAQLSENLGDAHMVQRQFDEAATAYQRAVDIRRERLGESHIATASARYKLASAVRVTDLPQSLELLDLAMEPYRAHFGQESAQFVQFLDNYARTLTHLNRHEQAERYYQEAWEGSGDLTPKERAFYLQDYIDARLRNRGASDDELAESLRIELEHLRQESGPTGGGT